MTAQGEKKSIITAVKSWREARARPCGTRAPSRSAFASFFFCCVFFSSPFSSTLSLSAPCPLTNPHRSAVGPPAVGRNQPLDPGSSG
ncbi:hypothetical protein CCMA1212_005825 [Trichoderma ghanense]|uniref:Uncharacterized protein n=1 Tax=Trichoderma ghanense TaxID=65468 RepID=A0ABY2H3Z4_9HYPO